jgi:predicted enzyme related to lactoylglutathione lyase
MAKVTGIGGVFFKCKNPHQISEWYKINLGIDTNQFGANFEWRDMKDSSKIGSTQWSPFNDNTEYFEPSHKEFMINYRVDNLEEMVEELRQKGVTVLDEIETYDYGKFVHIIDNEDNKIQLWKPLD